LEFSFLRWDVFFAVTTFLDVDGEAVWVKPSALVRGRESVDTTGPSWQTNTEKDSLHRKSSSSGAPISCADTLQLRNSLDLAILDQPSDDARQHRHAEQQDNEEKNGSAGSTWLVKSNSWYP
jgi:hypothetical protein